MKREGRQHGMVRSYMILPSPLNPRPEPRYVNRFESPPTAGLFTKVSPKPTNHSKFTGKCGRGRCVGCHIHPACKSKDKAKGTQKWRSCDVVSNHRLLTWRVVDAKSGLKFPGFSASGILDHLATTDYEDEEYDDIYDDDEAYEGSCGVARHGLLVDSGAVECKDEDDDNNARDDDDDKMSFCDVGIMLEQVDGDEGWCLVGDL
ncbi:unnamed protein product [Ilex paraguariensis]|uniref:Uncharacterized protein n=1 Tax=Ilex paraguariensis TaxID=185542 RepID=A0ABC8UHJ3_9AQUA